MRVVVRNDAKPGDDRPVKGKLVVIRKAGEREDPIAEQEITIGPGKQVFNIDQQIDQPDFYTYEAQFIPDDAAPCRHPGPPGRARPGRVGHHGRYDRVPSRRPRLAGARPGPTDARARPRGPRR